MQIIFQWFFGEAKIEMNVHLRNVGAGLKYVSCSTLVVNPLTRVLPCVSGLLSNSLSKQLLSGMILQVPYLAWSQLTVLVFLG